MPRSDGGDEAVKGQDTRGVHPGGVGQVDVEGLVGAHPRGETVGGAEIKGDNGPGHGHQGGVEVDEDAVDDEDATGGLPERPGADHGQEK